MKSYTVRIILGSIVISALCGASSGAEKKRIAVLPFSTENISKVTGAIVRDIIEVEIISSRRFTVIERDQMNLILKEQNIRQRSCDETACAYKYGKALSIDYMVIGKVMKLDSYMVSLRLIDIKNQEVLSADKLKTDSLKGLEKAAEELARNFLNQLNSGKPVYYSNHIQQNRPGTVTTSLFFQYTFMPSVGAPRFDLPENYGDPVSYKVRLKNRHAVGGGISTSVAILSWLSLRGSISYAGFSEDHYDAGYEKDFTEVRFQSSSVAPITPSGVSGDFLIQMNYLFGHVMSHIAVGAGYSYYWFGNDYTDLASLNISSNSSSTSDSYELIAKSRSHLVSIVGDAGFTVFFSNALGLTLSCCVRYAPKQPFHKNAVFTKTSGDLIDANYENMDEKLSASNGEAQFMYNFRFGFTLRML